MTDQEFNEIDETEKRLSTYDGEDKVLPVSLIKKQLGEIAEPSFKLRPGIECIEKYTQYFKGGDLVTLTGPPKNGKTLLAQSFVHHFSEQKHWGVFFSYEVNAPQFIEQFDDPLPYFYMPNKLASNTLKWIEERIWEAKLKYNCRYAIIDHLHFLIGMREAGAGNSSLMIGAVCRELKKMALKHNVVIFLLAHLKKVEMGVEPQFSDIRDSGMVIAEVDAGLLVWRKKTSGKAVIKMIDRGFGTYNQVVHVKKEGAYLEDDFEENMKEGVY
jgi:replicative DNA helicase